MSYVNTNWYILLFYFWTWTQSTHICISHFCNIMLDYYTFISLLVICCFMFRSLSGSWQSKRCVYWSGLWFVTEQADGLFCPVNRTCWASHTSEASCFIPPPASLQHQPSICSQRWAPDWTLSTARTTSSPLRWYHHLLRLSLALDWSISPQI